MPPKKGFEAFLKKNQKKGAKGPKAEEASQAQATETKADLKNELNDKDKNTTVTKKQNNNSSDDEEEDELDLATKQQVSYGTVKENKDIAKKNDKNDELVGYGLDEGKEENKAGQDKQPAKKAAFGEGASFGRPTFGGAKKGNKSKFGGGDFSAGLDDLDNPQAQAASNKQDEQEETKTESKGPVKPTFKGRMNLTGGAGANDNNSGVKTNYDFGVVYSTKRTEGEGGEKTEGERGNNEQRRQRKQRDHGTEFGKEKKQDDDDDDFQIVRDTKTRPKRKQANDSDSDDDTRGGRGGFRGARVQRGGERGRGGFFKNSAKRTE